MLERDTHVHGAFRALLYRERISAEHSMRPTTAIGPLQRARERLEDEVGNPSLAELADTARMTPWHFCRAFRERFGQPPHAYQLHARIRRAKRLLADGHAVIDVALQCGFTDQSHFTRHFRRLVDVTPGRYFRGKNSDTR
jgi:AraC-like DNA-binding protein